MTNGRPSNTSSCATGFDNLGYQIGSSSCAASFWYLQNITNGTLPQFAKRYFGNMLAANKHTQHKRAPTFPPDILDSLVEPFPEYYNISIIDALYVDYPNPFQNIDSEMSSVSTLRIVDGSLSEQTIPFWSLLWPKRKLDMLIAFDASAETPNACQNGTNLINTAEAAHAKGIPFPDIPDANTILQRRYN